MKLKIKDSDYFLLNEGKPVFATAINDNVSTSRHDEDRIIHVYESRLSVMRAFICASKAKVVSVVSEIYTKPIRAKVEGLGDTTNCGLLFHVSLKPTEARE